jgi:hypothetical protein
MRISKIDQRIKNFKFSLQDNSINDEEIVQKYIIHGKPFILDDDKYYSLKKIIADQFSIHFEHVRMIGSAKLGFSIVPSKLWKPFDDDSDLDMVIISEKQFDTFWIDLHQFNINLTVRSTGEEKKYRDFLEYFFKGWIRPDLFPFDYSGRKKWFDFFKSISYDKFGERKITGAIFKNFYFFESYHIMNIKKIRLGGYINV